MTWSRLIDLITRCKRPLVFVDYETTDLGGAPPVEYALAYWASWAAEEQDDTSRSARADAPPGLTYAVSERLNPGRPSAPGALRTHGITDAEVKKCKPYRDPAVVGLHEALARGDVESGEMPAIWCGHNVAEADVPWAQTWGYLPGDVTTIDTMRLCRRLAKDHPYPLAPDNERSLDEMRMGRDCRGHHPVIAHGLDAYAGSLKGVHVGLFGEAPKDAHGALPDVLTSARVLAGVLELWAPLWYVPVVGEDPHVALAKFLASVNAPPLAVTSWDGWLESPVRGDPLSTAHQKQVAAQGPGPLIWARGKHQGKPVRSDVSYARWVSSLPASPTGRNGEAWCSAETAAAISSCLAGVTK